MRTGEVGEVGTREVGTGEREEERREEDGREGTRGDERWETREGRREREPMDA